MNLRPAILIIFVLILVLAVGGMIVLKKSQIGSKDKGEITQVASPMKVESKMKLASSAFENNGMIPAKYTCDGEDVSPPLLISGVPETAVNLVLIVDDSDAPVGDFVHWTVWSIDPKTTEVDEGAVPAGGVEGMTDFGKTGWGGPCPPSGTHHYQFKLYALDTTLDLSSSAKKQDIEKAMEGHILDQTLLVGLYQRK